MPEVVRVQYLVPKLDLNMRFFDQLMVLRSTTGEEGPYIEVSTPAPNLPTSRLRLQPDIYLYDWIDPESESEFFYKFGLLNSETGAFGAQSEPIPAEEDTSLQIMSVDYFKRVFLQGLPLLDPATNEPWTDEFFEFAIRSSIAELETILDISIRPKRIDNETKDYFARDYHSWMFLQTNTWPILAVEDIRMVPPGNAQGNSIRIIPKDWIQLSDEIGGQINIVPVSGTFGMLVFGAWPHYMVGRGDFIPNFWHIQYTAGFDPKKVPADILDCIGMLASNAFLNQYGDVFPLGAGIAGFSLAMDGLSESADTTSSAENSAFSARVRMYNEKLKQLVPALYGKYHGMPLRVGG